MNFLRNVGIAPKMMATVALLLLVGGLIALMGLVAVSQTTQSGNDIRLAGEKIMHAGRGTANLIAYARYVERLGWDLSSEERQRVQNTALDEGGRFERRINEIVKMDSAGRYSSQISAARVGLEAYRKQHELVWSAASSGDRAAALALAQQGVPMVAAIRTAMRSIEEALLGQFNAESAEMSQVGSQAFWSVIAVGSIGGTVGLIFALWLIVWGVSRPLDQMTKAMKAVAGGDLDVRIPAVGQRDEIGQLAGALDVFKKNANENRAMRADREAEAARSEAAQREMMDRVASEFENSVGGIVAAVSASADQLKAAASGLSISAEDASKKTAVIAAASEQSSVNIQTVSAAAEEMATSVGEIGSRAARSASMANDAVATAGRTVSEIQDLADKIGSIGAIVEMITGIAAQTNLLALNATIEAARAGEAGRGFAVVAAEVKGLADQTARATTEISQKITAIQGSTSSTVEAMEDVSRRIGDIDSVSVEIAAAVEEQTATTGEIARNVQQASLGANEIAANIIGVSGAVASTGSSANEVYQAAGLLSEQASKLQKEVAVFVAKVRAA